VAVSALPVIRRGSAADHAPLVALLAASHLPTAGVPPTLADFLVAELDGRVVGAIGLERYGNAGLLRSAVVEPSAQGTGLGQRLVRELLAHATARGVREIYLLTTTAEHFFPRFGFERIDRREVPAVVQASVEFREACPASATVMRARLGLP
jgi:amino-acid N-acetyltransferase